MDLVKYISDALNEIKDEFNRLTSNNAEQSNSSSTYSSNTSHETFESKKSMIRNMNTYQTDNDTYVNNASTSKKKGNPLVKIIAIVVIISIVANIMPIFGTVFSMTGEVLDELAASEGYEETDTFVVERLLPEIAKEIKNAFTSEENYDSSEVASIPTKVTQEVKPTEEKETFIDKIATVFDKLDNKESTFDFGKITLYVTVGLVVGILLLLILRTATTKKDLTVGTVSQNDTTPEISMTVSTNVEELAEDNEEISIDNNQ